jgi:hypothetical protein
MATKPETAKLLKQAMESTQSTGKLFAKAEKPMAKWNQSLKAAIDEGSIPKIELYRPQAEKALEDVDNAIRGAKSSLALVNQLKADTDFMAEKFDTVEKLTVKVADMESRLVALRKEATDLDVKALKALDKLETGRDAIVSDLADVKDRYNDFRKAVETMETEGKKYAEAARKAFEDKKLAALTQARVKFLDLGYTQQSIGGTKIRMDAERLKKRAAGDRELLNQVQEILDAVPGLLERCKSLSEQGKNLLQFKVEVPAAESATAKNPDYQALRKEFEAMRTRLQAMEKDGERFDAESLKAQKNGDAKALSAARMKFLNMDYTKLRIAADQLTARAKKFQKENAVSSSVKGDLQEVIDYAPTFADRAQVLSKRGAELALLKVEASKGAMGEDAARTKLNMVQVAKIGDKLGVPVGENAKLAKLLNKEPYDKWAREVAKSFSLKEAEVKAKMAAVSKFEFVKPLYLIDI